MTNTRNDEPDIETANGSFYLHYKKGLSDFIRFSKETGETAVKSGCLLDSDLTMVERGVNILERQSDDLLRLLEKRIDPSHPSFFDECTIASIWNILGGVFLIAQHSGITDSALVHAKTLQGKSGGRESGNKRAQQADDGWRRECLKDAIAARRERPRLGTATLARELWNKMPNKPGKPASDRTVSEYLADKERKNELPRKIGSTASTSG